MPSDPSRRRDVVKSWLERQDQGTVTIKADGAELTSATRAQQNALVQAFLDRHDGS
ncbi:hypothetical protein [Amycolatopsis sp. NPDC004079]|uniref:hypothetical protein n=1 Tax=Amycolatopsis sp. NPDC004079 TaxID=3154549 RepID=UPI0033A992CE